MSLLSQKTLKKTATFSGVGLHNGKLAKVSVKPSEPNTGIVFKRVDLKLNNYVYPSFNNVTNTLLNTCLLYTSPSPRDLYRSRMPSSA